MSMPNVIVNQPFRYIQWVIFIVACSNWDCGFVASEHNRTKGRTMGSQVLCYFVLFQAHLISTQVNIYHYFTYCLLPWPISWHKIWILSLIILIAYILWCKVHFTGVLLIYKLVVEDNPRIIILDLKIFLFPQGCITISDPTIVLDGEALPRCTSRIKVIDGIIHLILAYKSGILIWRKSWCPDLKIVGEGASVRTSGNYASFHSQQASSGWA